MCTRNASGVGRGGPFRVLHAACISSLYTPLHFVTNSKPINLNTDGTGHMHVLLYAGKLSLLIKLIKLIKQALKQVQFR